MCKQDAPKRKPSAIKKKTKKATKGKPGKAKGASKGDESGKSAVKTNKKRKAWSPESEAVFLATCPPGRQDHYKLIIAKDKATAEKKRVHSKAYHAAMTLARRNGKGIEEAKIIARKAGADAALAWTKAQKK